MRRVQVQQPQGLISVLLNSNAEYGDRDDAAMDLGSFDDPQAEDALLKVALDSSTDPDLADRCRESLMEIQRRKNNVT